MCRDVESRYFPKPEFQEALKGYARARINAAGADNRWQQPDYLKYGGGESLPLYAVIEADGTLVAKTGWQGGPDGGGVLLVWMKSHRTRRK